VIEIGQKEGLHVCNLRPALTYGPGVKGNLNLMIRGIRHGWFPPLPDFSNRISMVSVYDLVRAADLAMSNHAANGKTYFVCDGEVYSTRSIYEVITRALGKKVPFWHVPWSALKMVSWLSDRVEGFFNCRLPLNTQSLARLSASDCYLADRIRQDLGWAPEKTLETEIYSMIRDSARN
jgi:nucleoside-diphosphate-sugar epimerase